MFNSFKYFFTMRKIYSYYSDSHRAWANVEASSKKEVRERALEYGDKIKLSDISLYMIQRNGEYLRYV